MKRKKNLRWTSRHITEAKPRNECIQEKVRIIVNEKMGMKAS